MTSFATGTKLLNPKDILTHIGVDVGMRVADLGCGNGYFTLTAAQLVGGRGQVYAVDILKSCLETVRREAMHHQLLNIKTIWSNLEIIGATKIPSESMDLLLVVHSLYQTHQKHNFLKEVNRLLKPGGKLLLVDWKDLNTPLGPPVEQRVGQASADKLIMGLGNYKKLEDFIPGEYHYALLYEKSGVKM
jgi:ubiquinone/menaquinone biosynthesis C-methylase UbiE